MDFDGDEILDLVSGSYDPGELYLFRGAGLGNFAAREVIVDQSGKPILKVPNQKDRVESFGSWIWYRNVGKKGEPRFAAPATLVAMHEGIGYDELLDLKHPQRPGIRSQIAVTDYDGDGKLDVLLGDFRSNLHVKPNLSDDERAECERVVEKRDKTAAVLRSSMDELREQFAKEMRGVPKSEWESPEYQAKWQQMYRQMKESAPYKKAMDKYDRLAEDLKPFCETDGARFGAGISHGFVWFFRRK